MMPLSLDRPKALLPTLDVPQLGWAVANLRRAAVGEVWVNGHHQADQVLKYVETVTDTLPMRINFSHEVESPLGTAGALKKISAQLGKTFIVINADVATNAPLNAVIEAHRSARAAATLLAVPSEDEADFVLEQGWLVELIDRRERMRTGHRYGGVAVFEREILEYIPNNPSGLYETVFAGFFSDGGRIAAVDWPGYWLDVATPAAHLEANLAAMAGTLDDAIVAEMSGDPIRHDSYAFVGRGATVDEVALRHAVVGHHAFVAPGSRLDRCVVWDGAKVGRGEYRDSILTGNQVVGVG